LEPIQPDAKVLMAAPLATKGDDIRGILDMESVRDHAFAPYWRQVLSYLADLIGFAMEIAEQRKDLLAREADRKSAEQLRLVYRELRHRIATLTGNLLGQADLLQKELSALEDADHNVTEPRRRVEVIRRNAEALEKEEQRLRKATQALGLDRRPIDLREAVLASVEYVRSRKSPEANEIAIEVSPGDPLPIDADQRWLEYALECVLDNAVDAITDQRQSRGADPNLAGRVSVSLAAAGNQASVTISDNGIGLDPELVEEIFAPLYSTKRQTVDNPELDAHGTGLFTARRVAQEHGGNLRASSPGPGQGAMFTFTLPLTS
jgi:signal transduction histidine kinase